MRELTPPSLSGHIIYVGLLRKPGMLHRTKYSRFRNESLTSLEEEVSNDVFTLKGSSSTSPLAPTFPIEEVAVSTSDSSMSLGTLAPRMAGVKLANPSTLPSLKNFCLRTKEVPRLKLPECLTIPSSPTLPEMSFTSCLSASYSQGDPEKLFKSDVSPQASCVLLGFEESAFLPKPSKDLGQKGESSLDTGISYATRYMGCIEVLHSMRSLDFGTRTQVTREAISRLCEAVPGAPGTVRKRKPPAKFLSSVLGKSNLQFSGTHIKLTISTNSLTLLNAESLQIIANHHMQSISFASGGDPDTTDYVAYVAKDPVNQRACHILECPTGVSQEVINTIGQAFELRFKQYLKNPSPLVSSHESEGVSLGGSIWKNQEWEDQEYYNEIPGKERPSGGLSAARLNVNPEQRVNSPNRLEGQPCLDGNSKSKQLYENCPDEFKDEHRAIDPSYEAPSLKSSSRMDLFDDPRYINTQNFQATPGATRSLSPGQSVGSPVYHSKPLATAEQKVPSNVAGLGSKPQLWNEECYHGKLTRKAAESLLIDNGDFLVRESTTSPGQYVLSGLQGGQVKHLLLVDPEGKVRTKDHVFDSVDHLIRFHMENKLPIVSSGSELRLCHPIRKGSGQILHDE